MALLNVPVIQVSSEMEKTVVLVSGKKYHTFSVEIVFCCGFVSQAGLTQAKKERCGELCIQAVPHHIV